jgi:hypothetical protein
MYIFFSFSLFCAPVPLVSFTSLRAKKNFLSYWWHNESNPQLPLEKLERSKRILANLTQFILRVETGLVYHDIYATLLGVPPARI